MKFDLHTHYYPPSFFDLIRRTPGDFSFGTDPTGRTIIRHRGARFFGVTAPMTDPVQRLADRISPMESPTTSSAATRWSATWVATRCS